MNYTIINIPHGLPYKLEDKWRHSVLERCYDDWEFVLLSWHSTFDKKFDRTPYLILFRHEETKEDFRTLLRLLIPDHVVVEAGDQEAWDFYTYVKVSAYMSMRF